VTDRLRNVSHGTVATAVAGVLVLAFAAVALAGSSFKNGGFETATFDGWNMQWAGDGAWFIRHAGPLPLSGKGWAGPTEHDFAAVSDQNDPAAGILYRNIKVGSKKIRLQLTVYYTNYAAGFCTPSSFDPNFAGCNQQFRVDILRNGADPWSASKNDILKSPFKTKTTNTPSAIGPTLVSANLTGLGDKVILRIAFVANEDVLNATVDNVVVSTG
jgi:hypothetical protein